MASLPQRAARPLDVLLWGATGFTGQLVAEIIAARYGVGESLRWGLGGRNRDKLEKVRSGLEVIAPRARQLPIVVGDNTDRTSLDACVRGARVVASAAGPYAIVGRELVAACVEAGTDYCDLTGEVPFIRDMIEQHHARAGVTGARIVHCCGFDSIPSDLGTLLIQGYMRERHGGRCARVKCAVGPLKGGMSGGSIASMIALVREASRDRRARRLLTDPYALDPERGEPGPDRPEGLGVHWDRDFGRWTGPFLMAAVNTRIVRRTNALLGYAYGRDFRYEETMCFRAGPRGLLGASAVSAATAGAFGALAVPPLRALLEKTLLPHPGEGPSKEQRDRGFFTLHFVGIGDAHDGAPSPKVSATVRGTSDPGYGETAKMLAESAVCLALDASIASGGGVLTPAACMGTRLVERLRAVGMTFEAREAT